MAVLSMLASSLLKRLLLPIIGQISIGRAAAENEHLRRLTMTEFEMCPIWVPGVDACCAGCTSL